jgi:hypothetical protein
MRHAAMLFVFAAVFLAGCDSKPKTPAVPRVEEKTVDIIKSQRQVLESAKGVGQTLDAAAEERRKAAEEAGGK